MSFKQSKKLFGIYQDSVNNFKDKYFMVKPLTPTVDASLFENMEYERDGVMKSELQCIFPLEWQYEHFERGTEAYILKDEDLNDQDRAAYQRLVQYFYSFRLVKCMTPDEKKIYDAHVQPIYAHRYIKMKTLLECCTVREAMHLLGISGLSCVFICLPSCHANLV